MNTTDPNTFEIIFCIAEDTYMYLPIYLAREKGIFESVIQHTPGYENRKIVVSFQEPKSSDETTIGGDREAVELMLSESEKGIQINFVLPSQILLPFSNRTKTPVPEMTSR